MEMVSEYGLSRTWSQPLAPPRVAGEPEASIASSDRHIACALRPLVVQLVGRIQPSGLPPPIPPRVIHRLDTELGRVDELLRVRPGSNLIKWVKKLDS